MNDLKKGLPISVAWLLFSICCIAQEQITGNRREQDSLYDKLYKTYESISFINKEISKIKLPKRKYDSPLFVNDLD